MLKTRILTPLVAGVLLVGLSACGSDDKSSDATTAPAATTADGDAEAASATDAAAEPEPTDAATADTAASGGGTDAGSPFCLAAEAAQTAGNTVDLDNGTPDEIEAGVTASVEAANAAADVAPDEIKDVIVQVASYQQQFADILAQYDWDLAKAASAPEFADLANTDVAGISQQLDAYLTEHCGLAS